MHARIYINTSIEYFVNERQPSYDTRECVYIFFLSLSLILLLILLFVTALGIGK